MKATTRYLVLLSMLVVGCGGSSKDDGDDGNQSLPETFECGDKTCKRATQYCATVANAETTHLCLEKKESCKSCDCVDLATDLTIQTGSQACTPSDKQDVVTSCAYYDDTDYIKAICNVRYR